VIKLIHFEVNHPWNKPLESMKTPPKRQFVHTVKNPFTRSIRESSRVAWVSGLSIFAVAAKKSWEFPTARDFGWGKESRE
jgi:hypothetical protein